jgi:hypothetical protein
VEHEPTNEPGPRSLEQRIRAELNMHMAGLGDPKEMEPFKRVSLAAEVFREYTDALGEGSDIAPITGRFIAYGIVAEAGEGVSTKALTTYYKTGEGSHDDLRAEYLMHYFAAETTPEERMLIDILGTHLFREQNRVDVTPIEHWRPDIAMLRTSHNPGDVDTVLQLPDGIAMSDMSSVINEVSHHIDVKGDAFKAFLRLPGIDVTADNLLSEFGLSYLGNSSQPGFYDVLLPSLQQRRRMGLAWDGIEIGGTTYVFAR